MTYTMYCLLLLVVVKAIVIIYLWLRMSDAEKRLSNSFNILIDYENKEEVYVGKYRKLRNKYNEVVITNTSNKHTIAQLELSLNEIQQDIKFKNEEIRKLKLCKLRSNTPVNRAY